MKLLVFTFITFCLTLPGQLIGQNDSDNVTFDENMSFNASSSPSSSNYMVNATIKKYHATATRREVLTGVNIEIFNKTTQKLELNIKDNPQSRFSFHFKHGNEYVIMLRKEGFLVKRVTAKVGIDGCIACFDGMYTLTPVEKSEVKSIVNLNMMMRPLNEGDRVIMPAILFEGKLTELPADAKKSLDDLAVLIKDNANVLAQLEVHTDSQGDADANLKLSKQRAKIITDYLVSKGIPSKDFYVKGYGERKIVNHCGDGVKCGEVQHRQNRRVIFWLRAQIGENELFNQPLTTILKNESNSSFAAPTEEAPKKEEIITSDKGDAPKEKVGNDKPIRQMDKMDEPINQAEINKFADEDVGNKVASADIVYPIQKGKSEKDKYGSSFLGNQVDIKTENVTDICDVDGIRPNSKKVLKKEDNDNKGIPVTRTSKDEVVINNGDMDISVQTEVTYDDGDAIVRRSGRATLVNKIYSGYKVELFTSEKELDNNHEIFKRYGKIFLDDTGTSFSYMIGSFQYKDGADKFLKTVILPFYPEAKVIRYKEGKRK